MKHHPIRSLLLLVFLFLAAGMPTVYGQGKMETEILARTNKFRESKGLPPLKQDRFMSELARDHSAAMANGQVPFGHSGFEQRVATIRKQKGSVAASAENVAYGQNSAEEVVDTWIKSPPHRKNMLGKYTHIGIGVSSGKGSKLYFTQIYTR
jgi:uncharacterized protein YkwD